jgi:hypothetical protein
MKKLLATKKSTLIATYLGLFLVSVGASWVFFSYTKGAGMSLGDLSSARSKITDLPKTEECPLNGGMFTTVEREIWDARRPMGVMIENHLDSRPQSGLSRADIVYEAVAEGGITRFLGLFYCGAAKEDVAIGPIRSARVYFIDWISEYGESPLYVHFGGANNICTNREDPDCLPNGTKRKGKVDPRVMAIEKLIDMGWRHSKGNALDGGANAGAPAIVRNQYRLSETPAAWEHSAVGSTDLLFDLGVARGFAGNWNKGFDSWQFISDEPAINSDIKKISFEFWSNRPEYNVEWQYDERSNTYMRVNGGVKHVDWEFDKPQLTAKNVVVMFIKEEDSVDEEHHVYYETVGGGEAIIFQNGKAIEGTWEKPSQFERTKFFDAGGKEIGFVRGTIWIEGVPEGNVVEY